jgi:hypothetical protein
MQATIRVGILSDIHYASEAERARGNSYEAAVIPNRGLRLLVRLYRRFIWMHEPLNQNHLLNRFLEQSEHFDYLVANGDYTCDSEFIGVSDPAAYESVRECLDKLREKFGTKLAINFGDHELGKCSFFGGRGGMRLASWARAQKDLGLRPFWKVQLGSYVLMGVVSSLVALPVFEPDTLAEERQEWERLRREHLQEINQAFAALSPEQRVVLFCHDPTALPFLSREEAVRTKLTQIEHTVIGHLHSNLIFWKSRWLAGIPRITFLGHTAKRMTSALREGRHWRPFHVRLCPALAGIQLLKDGGYLVLDLDPTGKCPAAFHFRPLPR